MAKGRKLTTSRSEIYLGSYGYNDHGQGTVNGGAELEENEVWSMADESVNGEWDSRSPAESNGGFNNYMSRRPIPRSNGGQHRHVGGLSLAFDDSSSSPGIVHQFRPQEDSVAELESPRGRHMATSAPVNVPDWSKIYRVDSVESMHDSDEGFEDNESGLIPPHEYLATSRKKAANSVFVGVGRTLKGRDLSRVRDAVWSRTGFNG